MRGFCNNPDNQETCFEFGKAHGMIPEEDLKMMEEGKQKFKEGLTQMPPEIIDCLQSLIGAETFEKIKSGAVMPPREIENQMKTCFEKMGPSGGMMPTGEGQPNSGEMMPPSDESRAYCASHPEECQKFQPGPGTMNPGGQIMPQQAGPGGCRGLEECQAYCELHLDECKNFGSGGGGQSAPGVNYFNREGQPGEFPSTNPTDCKTPEECQQMIQGRMMSPEFPQSPMNQQPPLNNITPPPSPPGSETLPPAAFLLPNLY